VRYKLNLYVLHSFLVLKGLTMWKCKMSAKKKRYLLYNYKSKKELHKIVFSHHGITYQPVTELNVIFAYYTEYKPS